jgi:hypothetical protein
MYTFNPSLSDLYNLCIDYIDNTAEHKINEKIYDCCAAYLLDIETATQKETLINYFNIQI